MASCVFIFFFRSVRLVFFGAFACSKFTFSTTMCDHGSEYVIYERFQQHSSCTHTYTHILFCMLWSICDYVLLFFPISLQPQNSNISQMPGIPMDSLFEVHTHTHTHSLWHRPAKLMKFASKCNAVNTYEFVKGASEYSIDVYSMTVESKQKPSDSPYIPLEKLRFLEWEA